MLSYRCSSARASSCSAMLDLLGRASASIPARSPGWSPAMPLAYALAAPSSDICQTASDGVDSLLIALFLFALDGLGIALATFEIAVALRILGGLASAVIIPQRLRVGLPSACRASVAAAMGVVMLGMTAGITVSPAIAGVLTGWIGLARALAGLGGLPRRLSLGRMARARRSRPNGGDGSGRAAPLRWLRKPDIAHPLLAKGLWNGRVSPPFCCREKSLRLRYALDVAQVGLSTAAFGIGLAVGNLSAGAATPGFRRGTRAGHHQCAALRIGRRVLPAALARGARSPVWPRGEHPGGRRPVGHHGAGQPLGPRQGARRWLAETLTTCPFCRSSAGGDTARAGKPTLAATVFLAGLGLGVVLTVYDAVRANRRSESGYARSSQPRHQHLIAALPTSTKRRSKDAKGTNERLVGNIRDTRQITNANCTESNSIVELGHEHRNGSVFSVSVVTVIELRGHIHLLPAKMRNFVVMLANSSSPASSIETALLNPAKTMPPAAGSIFCVVIMEAEIVWQRSVAASLSLRGALRKESGSRSWRLLAARMPRDLGTNVASHLPRVETICKSRVPFPSSPS